MGKAYTGVDIGDSSIKLAVCEDGVVTNVMIEALPEGLIAEGRIVSRDAMADFIKALAKRTGGIAKNAALVLPAADSLVRRLSLPVMTEKELVINLPYEFRDYVSQGKDRYYYDYAVLALRNGAEGAPESMDLLAVASPKQTIDDYLERSTSYRPPAKKCSLVDRCVKSMTQQFASAFGLPPTRFWNAACSGRATRSRMPARRNSSR